MITQEHTARSWHRWIVLGSSYISVLLVLGLLFGFPRLFSILLDVFRESRASTGTVHSIMTGVFYCVGIINGPVTERIGPHKAGCLGGALASLGWIISFFSTSILYLDFSIGVLTGYGISFIYISTVSAVNHHFHKKSGLVVLSILATSNGIGALIYPYIFTYCVDQFGVRGTFLLIGGVLLNSVPLSCLWHVPKNQENQDSSSYDLGHTNVRKRRKNLFTQISSLRTNKIFLIYTLGFVCLVTPSFGFIGVFSDVIISNGFSNDQVNTAFLIFNITNIFGRLLPGVLKQFPFISALSIMFFVALVSSATFAVLNMVDGFVTYMALCSLIGLMVGATVASVSVVTLRIVGQENLTSGIGIQLTTSGIGLFLTGPVNGFIKDTTGSYRFAIWCSVASLAASTLLFLFALVWKRKSTHKKKEDGKKKTENANAETQEFIQNL